MAREPGANLLVLVCGLQRLARGVGERGIMGAAVIGGGGYWTLM